MSCEEKLRAWKEHWDHVADQLIQAGIDKDLPHGLALVGALVNIDYDAEAILRECQQE